MMERMFHAGFGWVPKLRHCDGYNNQKAKYMTAIVAAKEGICVQLFVIELRCGSQWSNTISIYCTTILSTWFNPKELKVSPKDQIYTMLS